MRQKSKLYNVDCQPYNKEVITITFTTAHERANRRQGGLRLVRRSSPDWAVRIRALAEDIV